ncbi:5-carboxymethyl-2-hydroxymuconate Delta-isomerase [Nitratireductor mangrovi]|uniref:5-carboxymethyl-2-hydroxymuconate Delta-isomerase n=1 Tax=Nitratireductor mangrovi TaxID=2599600 RepID=A0A5B8L3Y8_9HYPH|nr:5-carboxymethyl-2-hydroxymuconate Delta-isomerase [Nitratireductor mangrovi]QDZ02523.1 5-carboxymethyl-2-hydroxymuconate Delta-isomerase [Nitratireductor mangrovi]
MPHFTIEYSANLDGKVDLDALCRTILKAALSTGVFETGAVRVRTVRCEHFAIADDLPENAFVDLSLRMGTGRSVETRKQAGETVFRAVEDFLAPLLATPNFALSFEIREIDPELSWRRNSIHPRLRQT